MKNLIPLFCIILVMISSCSKEDESVFYGEYSFSVEGDTYAGNKANFKVINGILSISLGELGDRNFGEIQIMIDAPAVGDYVLQPNTLSAMESEEAMVELTVMTGGAGIQGTPVNYSSIGGDGGIISITKVDENTLEGTFDTKLRVWDFTDTPVQGSFIAIKSF